MREMPVLTNENCSNECVRNDKLLQLEYIILLLLSGLAQPPHICSTNRRDTYKDAFAEGRMRRAPDMSASECVVCLSALFANLYLPLSVVPRIVAVPR